MVTYVIDLAEGSTFGVMTAEDGTNVVIEVTRGPLGMEFKPREVAADYTAALDRAEYLNAVNPTGLTAG